MSGYVSRENRARTASYHKDEAVEREVLAINRLLEAHEPPAPEQLAPAPHLFVFGLPRSGTTLAHQVLAWGLDVGYVSNVMARFWLAPHAGAILARAVLGNARDDSFQSDYAKTAGGAGGHEFAYFWHRWLAIEDVEDLLDFSGENERADWPGAAAAVRRIAAATGPALVFKTNFAGQFLPAFARTFPMPLFVYLKREPLHVALSILEARRRYYDDLSEWWSTHPPRYRALAGLAPLEQIAGQVAGLRTAYAEQIAKAAPELTIEVDYADLCADPAAVVAAIRERCLEVHGTAPALLHRLPAQFEHRGREPRDDQERALERAVTAALASAP